jgi:hypothetical protein
MAHEQMGHLFVQAYCAQSPLGEKKPTDAAVSDPPSQ